MEINKQLFEDVLSGKLKGKFVLRNGEIYYSDVLCRNYGELKFTHPYIVGFKSYTPKGIFAMHDRGAFDIVNFTPYTDMKENELTIEIPDGKIVDWDESKKQNKIVLKDKQLTYKEICKKLFVNKEFFFTNNTGVIESSSPVSEEYLINAVNNSTSYHQLECIMAKNMLANVAKYLNGKWNPTNTESVIYYLSMDLDKHIFVTSSSIYGAHYLSNILFKSKELAQQAIEILGKETVKLALEPLGI